MPGGDVKPPRDDDRPLPEVKLPKRISEPRGYPIIERQSTQRDIDRDRRTPKHGRAITGPFEEDITGKYQGADLDTARARRPTDERISRLEKKHDSLDDKVDRIDVAVATIAGKMDVIPDLIGTLRDELKSSRDIERVRTTTEFDIVKHEATSRIDTSAYVTKSRWQIIGRAAAYIFSAGGIGAVIALATQRC
jgi:hypothetical protein